MAAERLQKVIAASGLASRRAAEALIRAGQVTVNGQVVVALGTRVDRNSDAICVSGRPLTLPTAFSYALLFKPAGVVTTLRDPQGRPCVGDWVRTLKAPVRPVGRLDFDAEGALLLTDDGALALRLTHPRYQVRREYLAKVRGLPTPESLAKLTTGVRLDDGTARATEARLHEATERHAWIHLVVTEGRNHLVKRLCEAIGHPVLRLFRPSHAGISCQGLRPGEMRDLTDTERDVLRGVAEGKAPPVLALSLPPRRHRNPESP